MAQYYTDKQTILNLIQIQQPDVKEHKLRINLYMYFLFCVYIDFTNKVTEQYGVIEQDNFYPKYLFESDWYYTTYGPKDDSFNFDTEDTSYDWGTTSFDVEIQQLLVHTINDLENRSDFQLVDRWNEEPHFLKYYHNKYDGQPKASIDPQDIYDAWSKTVRV